MTTSRRIFLAHASEDKPAIRQLYKELKARSFEPWLDSEDLLPGQVWKTEIPKAIRDAGVFLASLSSRSVAKVADVNTEFRLALDGSRTAPRPALGPRAAAGDQSIVGRWAGVCRLAAPANV